MIKIWRGVIKLNPMDILFGEPKYSYIDVKSFPTTLDFPDGSYAVVITLQECYYGRPKLKRRVKSYVLDVDSPKGVPTHYDKSGGWKGDRTYGWGVAFQRRVDLDDTNPIDGWQIHATQAVMAWVLNERSRKGFKEP